MPQLGRFTRQLRGRFWKPPVEREVDAELAFHLDMLVAEQVARGVDPAAARAEALRRFGDLATITVACRDEGRRRDRAMRLADWAAEVRRDVWYALRSLRASPGFAAVAALTIALGIGTATTIFGIVNAVLVRPLPFPAPERLVRVWEANPTTDRFGVSSPNYLDWRERARSFEALGAYGGRPMSLTDGAEPERVVAGAVTPSVFRVLGVAPLLGRALLEEEGAAGSDRRVVVLSHALWQRRFGGDARVVGRSVSLDGTPYEVVGVMPPGFDFPTQRELWLPLAPSPTSSRADRRLSVVGRLRPGATVESATAEMRALARDLARQYPDSNRDWGVTLASFRDWIVSPELRTRVLVLLAAVGLLLLMACVNVANLMLARAVARQRDVTLRAALGAGRGRVVRQLLTESLVLALVGAALGVTLAVLAVPALREAAADTVPRLDRMTVDWRVLAFGAGAAALTGLLFGLAPAVQTSRADLHRLLRGGARVAAAGRTRSALIVVSVATATLLLVGAGLVGGSFARLMRVDPGFRPSGVLVASVVLPATRYPADTQRIPFQRELVRRLAALPGVVAAGTTNVLPLAGGSTSIPFTVEGRATPPGTFLQADWRSVTPGYFAALGIALRRGRLVEETDAPDTPPVIVISERMARHLWPDEDPIGKQVRPQGSIKPWTVVGVVGDARDQTIDGDPREAMYLSYRQVSWPAMWLLVRTAGDPSSLSNAVRREVWAIDRALPVSDVRPLADQVSDAAAQPRLTLLVFALFGGAALLLAVVGVYGIVAYGVAQRTREIGVRLALGARPGRVVAGVVAHGARLAALGIALGVAAAWPLSRYLGAILYEIAPTDLATYAGVALLLGAAATLASAIPAGGAARLDPVRALREERE
jgi:predicted permease